MGSLRWTKEQLEEFEARRRPKDQPQQPVAAPAVKAGPSALEIRFAQQIETKGLPAPVREFYFLDGRDFRLDFAYPHLKIGVEVQGMAHRIKGRFQADIEKRALALLAGWRVLEVSGATIKSGQAIVWLAQLLDQQ